MKIPNPKLVVTKMKCQCKLNVENMTVGPYPMTLEEWQIDTQIYAKQKLDQTSTNICKKREKKKETIKLK